MDGFTVCQRVLPCRWSIIRSSYLDGCPTSNSLRIYAWAGRDVGHTFRWDISVDKDVKKHKAHIAPCVSGLFGFPAAQTQQAQFDVSLMAQIPDANGQQQQASEDE